MIERRGNPTRIRISALRKRGIDFAARYNARVVLKVLPWRARGWTLKRCAERLNRQNMFSFRGMSWSGDALGHILKKFHG